MKILWVNPSFLDYRVPVYKRLNELTGGNFYILFSRDRVPERIPVKMREAIGDHSICFEGEKRIIIGEKDGLSNKWASIPITRGLYKQIKQINPDVVIAEGFFQWTPQAVRYAKLHHKPILIAYERTKHTERECPQWRTAYRQVIDKLVDGYLCNGILTKEYLEELGVKKEKLFIGGMSADSAGLVAGCETITLQDKIALRQRVGLAEGLTYLFVGRLVPLKGVKHLLVGWTEHQQKHPTDNLLLLGDGDEREALESLVAERGLKNVHFLGALDYDLVYQYYAIADVFVIPTLEDNWSLVVPEAMACGLPVACSIYNGCHPELVREGENGITFDPFEEETVVKALELFHQVNLQEYGNRSKEIEKLYNYEEVSKKILDACQEIYNRKK